MNTKIAQFLSAHSPETPCLVVDLDLIAEAYQLLSRYLSVASIYYAVKANPAPEIVAMLARKGSNFDVASPAEIALCLGNGASAERLSFGNTIKKEKDIAFAYEAGSRANVRRGIAQSWCSWPGATFPKSG
jgi:ornithine decarboxylase